MPVSNVKGTLGSAYIITSIYFVLSQNILWKIISIIGKKAKMKLPYKVIFHIRQTYNLKPGI